MSIGDDKTAPAAPDREPAVVCVTGLGYHWPGTAEAVLRDFSLRLGAGERVFIRGPSGSGKTTLISLIGGLLVPDAGRIALLGRETTALGAAARDRLRADHTGFIFQSFNLVPYLSLVDNVLLACRFSARRRERALQAGPAGTHTGSRRERLEAEALRLLRRLQIPEAVLRRTRVTELSMGQQQRVAAARALIGRPDLVIADEPTSALDADARDGFIELLFEECAAASASLLFVSHDEALAARFDRSIVLAGATPTAAIAGTAARDPAGAGNRC